MKKQSGKKLVEILAVELKEWPDDCKIITQSFLGNEIYGGRRAGAARNICKGVDLSCRHSEEGYPEVTREMWEAERAKLSKPKANAQGWIRHRGGKCPVEKGTAVDIRVRSGEIAENCKALTFESDHNNLCAMVWSHENPGHRNDIMAYRLHQPEQSAESVGVKVEVPVSLPDGYGEVINTTLVEVDGPLQWRDRITEIDREVEALEEERASLIQRLADEGFKLIKRESVELPDMPDMSDWRNWREGDIVRCVSHTEEWSEKAKIGEEYVLKENPDPEADSGLHIYAAGYYMSPVDFKFVSRPTK